MMYAVVTCLDVISAMRLASCSKKLWNGAKPLIEARPELLPRRIVMAFIKELQPRLLSEYEMATTVRLNVMPGWWSRKYQKCMDKVSHMLEVVDEYGNERVTITWSLDTAEFEMFFYLPYRGSTTIRVQPSSELAGTIWTDDSSYEKGLWQEILGGAECRPLKSCPVLMFF